MKFQIEVRPNSKKSVVTRLADGDFKVFVKAPAKEGEANKEVIALVAKYFGVAKSCVAVLRGARGKKKIIEIEGRVPMINTLLDASKKNTREYEKE